MRITKLHIINFKRFSDLTIEGIPSKAKLVLLIGANGSGKTSIFDAFDYVSKSWSNNNSKEDIKYYQKQEEKDFSLQFNLSDNKYIIQRYSANEDNLEANGKANINFCLLYTSPSPRDRTRSRMPSSA